MTETSALRPHKVGTEGTHMKRILAAAGIGAALAAIALVGAGTASADTGSSAYYPSGTKGDQSVAGYYHDLTAEGLSVNGYNGADQAGADICSKLARGETEADLINTGVTINGLNRNGAKVAVWSAEWHFCPRYY